MASWNEEKVELKLRESLRESLNSPLYFDTIDYRKFNLTFDEAKRLVARYCEHQYGHNYKWSNKVWVTVESDRIKIEKR
ncbi:MAG: hypothetical protein C0172_00575 [Caldisphaera sp.]|nr:MAG: hypothetical protein C0172_00575 [Caldisphaera sp.]